MIAVDGAEEVAVDMTAAPWWRDCIASHKAAEEMSAVGITGFSAQPILGIKDSNRQHHTRGDFVIFLADGPRRRPHLGAGRKCSTSLAH